jgi:hypothetical protein
MADFFTPERLAGFARYNDLRCEPGRFPMTFASKLPVIVAYLAFAFVGAIVLGVF